MSIDFDPDHVLTVLVHGFPGTGKTPSSVATAPGPVLVLDVEGRTHFIQRPKIRWDPRREAPPEPDGTWEICVVQARDWPTMQAALDYVIAGKHPFRSVVVDSIPELQKRAKDQIGSGDTLSERLWGELLIKMEGTIRQLRDSATHPTQPVQLLILTAWTEERDGQWGPWVQGALVRSLPGMVDVIGYLHVDESDPAGPSAKEARRLLVAPGSVFVAKDATTELPGGGISGHFGSTLTGPIDWTKILETIFE